MIVTPTSKDLDFLKSDLVRSPGVHASDVYSDLFAFLDPKRYDHAGNPNPVLMALGTAWEKHLEYLLEKNGVKATRPGELISPEGIAYSPDLIIFNGVTRCGEIKLTSLSDKDLPDEETDYLPPKFDKYLCVAPITPILTSDLRYIRADRVQPGDSLLAFDEGVGGRQHFRHTRVTATQIVQKPTVRLVLADNSSVVCSTDHQWLASTKGDAASTQWRWTRDLLKDDQTVGHARTQHCQIIRSVPPLSLDGAFSDLDRGWLEGIADGEGSLHHRTNSGFKLTLSQKPGLVLTRLKHLLKKGRFWYTETAQAGCVSLVVANQDDVLRFLATIRPMRLLNKYATEMGALQEVSYADQLAVVKREPMGTQPTIAIQTETRTYIANGLASHNCQLKLYCYWLEMPYGWLGMVFNYRPFDPQFRAYNLTFTPRELQENHQMCMNHARSRGLL